MPKRASPDPPAARQRLRRLATIMAFAMAAFTSLPGLAQVQPEFESLSGAELSALDAVFALPRPVPIGTSLAAGSTPLPAIDAELSFEAHPLQLMEGPDAPDLGSEDDRPSRDYASFGEDVTAIKWELAAVAGYYTAINAHKLFKDPKWPTFQAEGWFGKSTNNVGVDKLAHAYSAYVISELLYGRLKRKTGDAPGIQYSAAALASAVMLGTEAFDSIEPSSGWSWEDVAMNTAGAGFSVLRNSVPGLDEKLDYRLMIQPNEDVYTVAGKKHFEQQRYFFALKLSGFEAFDRTPLRFVEMHLGYRGADFRLEDRAAGIEPKRHVFVGLGLNLRELLFKNTTSPAGRAAGEVLDYFQLPYTAVHHSITE